jgi:hypothetical protein
MLLHQRSISIRHRRSASAGAWWSSSGVFQLWRDSSLMLRKCHNHIPPPSPAGRGTLSGLTWALTSPRLACSSQWLERMQVKLLDHQPRKIFHSSNALRSPANSLRQFRPPLQRSTKIIVLTGPAFWRYVLQGVQWTDRCQPNWHIVTHGLGSGFWYATCPHGLSGT